MSILDRFSCKNSAYARCGVTVNGKPGPWPGSDRQSELHFLASITDNPSLACVNYKTKSPSTLDLNGEVPICNYKNNAPEGASF